MRAGGAPIIIWFLLLQQKSVKLSPVVVVVVDRSLLSLSSSLLSWEILHGIESLGSNPLSFPRLFVGGGGENPQGATQCLLERRVGVGSGLAGCCCSGSFHVGALGCGCWLIGVSFRQQGCFYGWVGSSLGNSTICAGLPPGEGAASAASSSAASKS